MVGFALTFGVMQNDRKKSRTHDGCGVIATNAGSLMIYLYR